MKNADEKPYPGYAAACAYWASVRESLPTPAERRSTALNSARRVSGDAIRVIDGLGERIVAETGASQLRQVFARGRR